jgi:lipopolysaccharide export system permease protein
VKILNKYVLKEHVGPLLFALSALTSLLLLNYIARQFGNLVGKGLPWTVIVEFLALSVPFTIAMTLPMAVLVSTLYAFSRLASENEVTAMKASGVGLAKLLIPVMAGGAVLALAMILFNDQILPRANHRLSTLQRDIASKKPTFALKEQVINEVKKGSLSLRAARIVRATNRMHDVMILDYSDQASRKTIYADSGDLAFTQDNRDLLLVLYNGEMVETNQGEPGRLQRLFFNTNTVKIEGVGNTLQRSNDPGQYKSDRERTICDMQAELAAAEMDHRAMSAEVSALMAGAAQHAATGVRPRIRREMPDSAPSWGLGRLYCTVLGTIAPPLATPDDSDDGNYARSMAAIRRNTMLTDTATPLPEGDQLTAELEAARSAAVSRLEERNAFDVEIQKKFSIAIACMVFILIGAPVALRFPRGGVGLVIGVSLGVFALYYVGLIAGEDLADKNIVPPFAAMWVTNVVLTLVGVVLLARMGKEGSTARGGDMSELFDAGRAWMARQMRRLGLHADRRRKVA